MPFLIKFFVFICFWQYRQAEKKSNLGVKVFFPKSSNCCHFWAVLDPVGDIISFSNVQACFLDGHLRKEMLCRPYLVTHIFINSALFYLVFLHEVLKLCCLVCHSDNFYFNIVHHRGGSWVQLKVVCYMTGQGICIEAVATSFRSIHYTLLLYTVLMDCIYLFMTLFIWSKSFIKIQLSR